MKKSTITIPLLLLFSFFFSLSVYAQSQIEVTGKVLDASSRSPLEFTTVIFIDSEDTMVSGGITNQNGELDRKSTRLNSSHVRTSYAVCCSKKNTKTRRQ